jgi:hypothetical protein
MISRGWDEALGTAAPNSGAEVYVINKIDQVTTRGTIGMAPIYNPLAGQTQQTTCLEGRAACLGRFWLDPTTPQAPSRMRPAYRNTIMGQAPYSVTDRKWNAVTMIYQNPGSGVTYHVIYDAASGLVLAYPYEHPSEKVYMVLNSTMAGV